MPGGFFAGSLAAAAEGSVSGISGGGAHTRPPRWGRGSSCEGSSGVDLSRRVRRGLLIGCRKIVGFQSSAPRNPRRHRGRGSSGRGGRAPPLPTSPLLPQAKAETSRRCRSRARRQAFANPPIPERKTTTRDRGGRSRSRPLEAPRGGTCFASSAWWERGVCIFLRPGPFLSFIEEAPTRGKRSAAGALGERRRPRRPGFHHHRHPPTAVVVGSRSVGQVPGESRWAPNQTTLLPGRSRDPGARSRPHGFRRVRVGRNPERADRRTPPPGPRWKQRWGRNQRPRLLTRQQRRELVPASDSIVDGTSRLLRTRRSEGSLAAERISTGNGAGVGAAAERPALIEFTKRP